MRSLLAILIGYSVFGLSAVVLFQLAHVDPHQQPGLGFMFGSTLYGILFAAAAGYVAAWIATRRKTICAGIVALMIALLALISIIAQPGLPRYWSQIAAIVLMAPTAVLGGWLRARQTMARKETP